MSKKKFKDTFFGGLLTSKVVSTVIKSIPGVGQLAGNIIDEVKGEDQGEVVSESGSVNWKDPGQIIAGVITLVLLYLAMTGKISFDEADQARDFLQNK